MIIVVVCTVKYEGKVKLGDKVSVLYDGDVIAENIEVTEF